MLVFCLSSTSAPNGAKSTYPCKHSSNDGNILNEVLVLNGTLLLGTTIQLSNGSRQADGRKERKGVSSLDHCVGCIDLYRKYLAEGKEVSASDGAG